MRETDVDYDMDLDIDIDVEIAVARLLETTERIANSLERIVVIIENGVTKVSKQ